MIGTRPLPAALALAALAVLCALPALGQPFQSGSELSSRLTLKVLLSSEDALSAGRFDGAGIDSANVDFETRQLGVRWRLGDSAARPFVGAFAGRYEEELRGQRGIRPFDATTVGVEAGADVPLGKSSHDAGWFFEPRAALGTPGPTARSRAVGTPRPRR